MSTLLLTVHPRSSRTEIRQTGENEFSVWVTAVPEKGKANDAALKALAEFLDIPKSRLTIEKGAKGRKKRVRIA